MKHTFEVALVAVQVEVAVKMVTVTVAEMHLLAPAKCSKNIFTQSFKFNLPISIS